MVSPMRQYSCEDGFAADWHLIHFGSRAVGGAGLVMAEATAEQASGRISPHDLGVWKDEHIEALARVALFVSLQGAVPPYPDRPGDRAGGPRRVARPFSPPGADIRHRRAGPRPEIGWGRSHRLFLRRQRARRHVFHRHGGVHHLRPAGRSHYPQQAGRPRHRGPAGPSRPRLAAARGRRASC